MTGPIGFVLAIGAAFTTVMALADPSDIEMMKYLSTMGVGGAIAAFIFMFYRREKQLAVTTAERYADSMRLYADMAREDRRILMELVKSNSETLSRLAIAIDNNTSAVTWAGRESNHHGHNHSRG